MCVCFGNVKIVNDPIERRPLEVAMPFWDCLVGHYPKNPREDLRYCIDSNWYQHNAFYREEDTASAISAIRISLTAMNCRTMKRQIEGASGAVTTNHPRVDPPQNIIKDVVVLFNRLLEVWKQPDDIIVHQIISGHACHRYLRKNGEVLKREVSPLVPPYPSIDTLDFARTMTTTWAGEKGVLIAIEQDSNNNPIPRGRHLAALWDGKRMLGGYEINDWLDKSTGNATSIYFWKLEAQSMEFSLDDHNNKILGNIIEPIYQVGELAYNCVLSGNNGGTIGLNTVVKESNNNRRLSEVKVQAKVDRRDRWDGKTYQFINNHGKKVDFAINTGALVGDMGRNPAFRKATGKARTVDVAVNDVVNFYAHASNGNVSHAAFRLVLLPLRVANQWVLGSWAPPIGPILSFMGCFALDEFERLGDKALYSSNNLRCIKPNQTFGKLNQSRDINSVMIHAAFPTRLN